ncbi:DUF2193 domain-containing protein [Methanorbis rubei]|uniref:DUF2193 domain-containing protein n=1 Tax=Methanorbis rubei TaxID=3028300 RepID=A0AAE4MJ04_9EURY|nr:hypothetical protein [Methanocorpusculaceae archaeon Cs1]
MSDIYKKMVEEALAAQYADVNVLKQKRGTKFSLTDAKPYVDAVSKMTVADGQSAAVINLHKASVKTHFEVLSSLTGYVRPEDDPFVEHYQTPVILEILCDEDKKFAKSMDTFAECIKKNENIVGREAARGYAGFYGPTCVVDFALMPGSTSNVVNQILQKTDIPTDHKQAILAAKSWGMNTSYGIGDLFAKRIEAGDTLAEASDKEVKQLQALYQHPVKAQVDLMNSSGMTSFDPKKYMDNYRKGMEAYVKAAIDDGVHYGNIATIPAYCVGDISHHISQSTYNMCKDDVVMATIEAVTGVIDKTLHAALPNIKSGYQLLDVATGASAVAAEYLLEMDGFNAPMIVDLLTKRYHNLVMIRPTRGAAAELHNCDFMDMIYRGWKILDKAQRVKNGSGKPLAARSGGMLVDLSPIHENEVLMNPQRYAYPACAITVRASALMRIADYPCLLTSEPITATMMTNIIALDKGTPAAPARACKSCATACLIGSRHQYCQYREAV